MFELWWQDRLIDVVPALAEVPAGLTVKSRAIGPREPLAVAPPDWRFTKVLAIALLMFIACVMVMTLTPVSEGGADDGLFQQRMVTKLVLPPEPPKALPKSKFADRAVKQMFAANAPSRSRTKLKASALLSIWDDGLRGLGMGSSDAIDRALGRLGNGPGQTADAIGFGPGGGGPRGGGPGFGPGFGIGSPGARGPRGKPSGSNLGPKRDHGPESGPIKISDGLSRDLVAKVIRAHANEIKYCYERELQHTPGLTGKVAVAFTIGPVGDVVDAQIAETTLENPSVESCMLDRVKRWRFPEPNGGGTVDVNHPWIFRGAGDNDP